MNLLDIKVNPNCLLFSERERRWSGGMMVLSKLSVPRHPTNLVK